MRFQALRHRNFRLYFAGQFLSMSGTWMQRVAEGWLVYRLTHSPLMLGLLAFAGSAPALFFSPVAGVIADQVNRHRMVQVAQALAMAQACILALFTLQGWITPNLLLFFALIMGTVRAFANPARQSFLVELIPAEDLTNAVALSAIFSNLARIAGPALAGFIVAGYGEGFCFLANGLSFLLTISCLQLMRFGEKERRNFRESQWELLLEGFQYIRKSLPIRSLLFQFAAMNFAGAPYITLMPIFAGTVLGVGPTELGWLLTASGTGALICSIGLASRNQPPNLLKLVMCASLVFGGALVSLALSNSFYVSLSILPLIGGGYILILAGTQTLLQTLVSDELRGRVMSFYSLVFLGFQPFGSLLAGWISEYLGVAVTLGLGGASCLGVSLLSMRSISRRKSWHTGPERELRRP